MQVYDISNPLTLILLLIVTILLIFVGKEVKKPHFPAISLILFLIFIVIHSIQLSLFPEERMVLMRCIGLDFLFIFISFLAYLWVDDISAKFYKKKSVDNSLDWFWDKV